jgi:hypothetical protein
MIEVSFSGAVIEAGRCRLQAMEKMPKQFVMSEAQRCSKNTKRGNRELFPRFMARQRLRQGFAPPPADYVFAVRVLAIVEKAWFRPVAR